LFDGIHPQPIKRLGYYATKNDKDCANIKYRLADLKDMLNVLLNREQIFEKMREKAFMENEHLIVSVKNLYKIYKEKEEVEEND